MDTISLNTRLTLQGYIIDQSSLQIRKYCYIEYTNIDLQSLGTCSNLYNSLSKSVIELRPAYITKTLYNPTKLRLNYKPNLFWQLIKISIRTGAQKERESTLRALGVLCN